MTPDIVADLHPPRLPAEFAAPGWPELLAAFGAGLLLAALILFVAAPMLRPRRRWPRLGERLTRAAALPPEERLLELARLLAERGVEAPEDLRAALYSGAPCDPARIEALLRGARPGRGRGRA